MGMGQREYARHRGVSLAAVQKALASGRIKSNTDGSIDPVKADKAWEKNTDPAQQRNQPPAAQWKKSEPIPTPTSTPLTHPNNNLSQRQEVAPTPETQPTKLPPPPKGGIPDYQQSRAAHEYYNAQKAKQEYEYQKKILVNRKEVDDEIFAENRRVRDRLQNIPSRVAPILAAMTDIREIEKMLDQDIYDALMELS